MSEDKYRCGDRKRERMKVRGVQHSENKTSSTKIFIDANP